MESAVLYTTVQEYSDPTDRDIQLDLLRTKASIGRGDNRERPSIQVGAKFIHCPNEGEAFTFGD